MSSNKVTIVLVGETGVGKSTLIQFFTNKDTGSTDSIKSGTKDPTIYSCNVSKNRDWMDTQGTSDSECKESDYEIMIKTLKTLQKNKTKNIKVLWLVPKLVREKAELQKQAKYINSLLPTHIWKSVIIFIREGRTVQDIKAAIGAACNSGLSNPDIFKWNSNAFGYTLLEKLPNNDPLKEMFIDLPLKSRIKSGFLKNQEAKEKVLEMLGNISSCKVAIKDNEKCIKCGQKGDVRLFDTNCHSEKEELHLGSRHHPGYGQKYHPGIYDKKHSGIIEYYHPGNQRNGSRTTGRVFAGIFSLGISETKNWKWWSCCKAREDNKGCRMRHTCDSGCGYEWTCCSATSSNYSGCKQKWSCCSQNISVQKGCRFDCCNSTSDKDVCKIRCKRCRGDWGEEPDKDCIKGDNNKHHKIVMV